MLIFRPEMTLVALLPEVVQQQTHIHPKIIPNLINLLMMNFNPDQTTKHFFQHISSIKHID